MLENLLVARGTGDMTASTHDYEQLRRDFIADPEIKALLPPFVRTCRTLDVFWPFIEKQAGDADRALFAALAEPTVSALRVTIPRARADEHLAGGSRSRVPPDGGAMLTLLRLPF